MKNNIYPQNYKSILNLVDTQIAIKLIKDTFERELAKELDLMRVSAPLFVEPETGLNDNLSGFEKAVNFVVNEDEKNLQGFDEDEPGAYKQESHVYWLAKQYRKDYPETFVEGAMLEASRQEVRTALA